MLRCFFLPPPRSLWLCFCSQLSDFNTELREEDTKPLEKKWNWNIFRNSIGFTQKWNKCIKQNEKKKKKKKENQMKTRKQWILLWKKNKCMNPIQTLNSMYSTYNIRHVLENKSLSMLYFVCSEKRSCHGQGSSMLNSSIRNFVHRLSFIVYRSLCVAAAINLILNQIMIWIISILIVLIHI